VTEPRLDAVARAREAALAELRQAPVARSWRRQAAAVAAIWVGLCLAAGAAALLTALAGGPDVAARAPLLAALLAVAALGGVSALAPRVRSLALLTVGAASLTMAVLVLSRGADAGSTTPGWVCSLSHAGLGLLPLAVGLWSLRQSAWSWRRAIAAGLGAGTAGAFLGELACHQGAAHVLVHHIGAWVFVAIACVLISRRLPPRTFAP
jgi:hypothetical protein